MGRRVTAAILVLIGLLIPAAAGGAASRAVAAASQASSPEPPEDPDRVVTLQTEDGDHLLATGLRVRAGDRFIDAADNLWVVVRVDGDRAVARLSGRSAGHPPGSGPSLARMETGRPAALPAPGPPGPVRAGPPAPQPPERADVVIYHTHSDESYIPTDGTHSVDGKGGIYWVGASLRSALERTRLTTVQRQENHNPRDHGAYVRSRRTALQALRQHRPLAMFDVHRDAAPAREYAATIGGRPVSRVMIVIGGRNPGHEGNLAFARLLKAEADRRHPGLTKGIYIARGNYNQDIYTRNLLLEVGSHLTSREQAERGVALFAEAVAPALRAAGVPGSEAHRTEERAALRGIVWLLLSAVLVGGSALVLFSGGVQPALARLRRWREEVWDPLRQRRR